MINLTDLNYALMGSFLIINIVTFILNFRFTIKHHVLMDDVPSFSAETELMHWSLYGSLALPLFSDGIAKNGALSYFGYAGILVVLTIVAIIIGTHRHAFDHWLLHAFSDDKKDSNSEKSGK